VNEKRRKGKSQKEQKTKKWMDNEEKGEGKGLPWAHAGQTTLHMMYILWLSVLTRILASKQHKELILTSGLASSLLHTPMESCQKGCCFLYAGCSTPIPQYITCLHFQKNKIKILLIVHNTNIKVAVKAKQCKLMLKMNSVVDIFNGMDSDVNKLHTCNLQHQQTLLPITDRPTI